MSDNRTSWPAGMNLTLAWWSCQPVRVGPNAAQSDSSQHPPSDAG